MNNSFYQSIVVQPVEVGGIRLLPLSAWHVALMEIDENPFWYATKIGVDDIARTIWIMTSRFGSDMFGDAEKARMNDICKAVIDIDQDEAIAGICQQITDYTKMPIIDTKSNKTKMQATPIAFRAVTAVMANLHVNESEAWDMPFNRLLCYWFENLSANGIVELTNEKLAEWARGDSNG
jgi:hypothetical protein